MKDFFDIRELKIAMLETLLELGGNTSVNEFCAKLLDKFESKEDEA